MTRYFIFGLTGLALLLSSISTYSVAVAFPNIINDFQVSLILAGWVLLSTQLMATICMPLSGKAGEVFGLKRTYLFALAVFTAGSLICALSPNITVLILGRLIQAVGTGSLSPLATVIISKAFPESRQRAIGFFGSIYPIGTIIGPSIGGLLVESFGWRSTFWLNIPLGLILFFASLKVLKAGKGEGGQLDFVGIGYFTGAISAFLIFLNTLGNVQSGGSWLIPGALFVTAIALFVAFLRREVSIKDPVIEPYFLKRRPFLETNIYFLVYGAAALGIMSLVPLFATSVYGMTTLQSGLIMMPRAIGTVLAVPITSYYLPRWGYRWPIFAGTVTLIISLILLGLKPSGLNILGINFSDAFLVGLFLFLAGIGTGIVNPAARNVCLDLMPERIGTLTGLRGLFTQSGSAISIAVTTLVLHYFSDIGRGFTVAFLGLGLLLLIAIPTVFLMPKSPNDVRWTKKSFW